MAKIGLNYPVYKTSTSAGVMGKAIQADISIEMNDGKLYGDDSLAEVDRSFKTGTLTLGVTDLSDAVQAALLGHAIANDVMTAKGTDTPAYASVGFYGVKMVSNEKYYRGLYGSLKYCSANRQTLTLQRANQSHLEHPLS